MSYTIRPARPDDGDAIAGFTQDTFTWGDYVSAAFPDWIADERGRVMVAVDDDDRAIALSRGVMLSDTELWLQGARVSEPWRRQGVASALGEALIDWAIDQGARIARLLTEGWNEPAQRQVERSGFRCAAEWMLYWHSVSDGKPDRSGNGGQRAKARRRLEIAHSSEAVPAWVSWRSGPLVRAARGLYVQEWRLARLTVDYLELAGKQGRLRTSQAGWVVTRHEGDSLYIEWLECGPDDIDDMIRSLIDLAVDASVKELRIIVPKVGWLITALANVGFENESLYLYERPL
jgi:GNAT superfamily N-acetyltransferase